MSILMIVDGAGYTVFHYAAVYGTEELIKTILYSLDSEYNQTQLINKHSCDYKELEDFDVTCGGYEAIFSVSCMSPAVG